MAKYQQWRRDVMQRLPPPRPAVYSSAQRASVDQALMNSLRVLASIDQMLMLYYEFLAENTPTKDQDFKQLIERVCMIRSAQNAR